MKLTTLKTDILATADLSGEGGGSYMSTPHLDHVEDEEQTRVERLIPFLPTFLPVLLICAGSPAAETAPPSAAKGTAATEQKNNFDWQSNSANTNSTRKVANI